MWERGLEGSGPEGRCEGEGRRGGVSELERRCDGGKRKGSQLHRDLKICTHMHTYIKKRKKRKEERLTAAS